MNRLLLFLLCLFTSAFNVIGQTYLTEHFINPYYYNGSEPYLGDFNNDGFDDFIVYLRGTNQVWLYTNDGNANFTPNYLFDCPNHIIDMKLNDLNQDSFTDMVFLTNGNPSLIQYANDGQGNFTPIVLENNIPLTSGISLSLENINFDVHRELIVHAPGDENIRIYGFDNNNYTSSSQTLELSDSLVETLFFVDVNGDGLGDWIYRSYAGGDWSLRVKDGSNNISNTIIIDTFNYSYIDVLDLNNDGLLDFVLDGRYSYYGEGSFTYESKLDLLPVYPSNYIFRNRCFIDIDNDNDLDMLFGSMNNVNIAFQVNDSSFDVINLDFTLDMETENYSFAVSDFNDNGQYDIIAAGNHTSHQLNYFFNNGDTTFSGEYLVTPIKSTYFIKVVDFDGDGDNDIFTSGLYHGSGAGPIIQIPASWGWYENTAGVFGRYQEVHKDTIDGYGFVDIQDFDNDGDLDVFTVSNDNNIDWFENDGNGNFTVHDIYANNYRTRLYFTDFNNDSILECLINTDYFISEIAYIDFTNNNNLVPFFNASQENYDDFNIADVDGDGHLDVILLGGLGIWGDDIIWYRNDGNGSFTPFTIMANYPNTWLLHQHEADYHMEDLDNDGVEEFIIINPENDNIDVFKRSGNSFTLHSIPGGSETRKKATFIDIDDDGDLDIAYFESTGFLGFFENIGNLSFIPINLYDGYSLRALDMELTDMNNDGILDFLVASSTGGKISWFEIDSVPEISLLSVLPYFDINSDSAYQAIEPSLASSVSLLPTQNTSFTSSEFHNFILTDTGQYELVVNSSYDDWSPVIDDEVNYNLSTAGIRDTIEIGFYPEDSLLLFSDIMGGWPRCGDTVTHNIIVDVWSFNFDSGLIEYELDDSLVFIQSEPAPDSIYQQKLFYFYTTPLPSIHNNISVDVRVPINLIPISHNLKVYAYQPTLEIIDSAVYFQQVACSYDPNDKTAIPEYGNAGYVLNDEELEFVIRFQNTGNDTAFLVVIKDFIDLDFDLSTFKLLNYSHDVEISIDQNTREVTFTFNDINLLDSLNHEPESHGFVKYAISSNPGLSIGNTLENTAYIFFDQNAAITTNTTLNTLYDCNQLGESLHLPFGLNYLKGDELDVQLNELFLSNVSYYWNDNPINGSFNGTSLLLNNVGDHEFRMVMENDLCQLDTTLLITVDELSAINELDNFKVLLFPNPANLQLHLRLSRLPNTPSEIVISDILGRTISRQTLHNTQQALDIENLSPGVFIVSVVQNHHTLWQSKFIKE